MASGEVQENEIWSEDELKLAAASKTPPSMKRLGLRGLWKVTDFGFIAALMSGLLNSLECLDLTGVTEITDDSMGLVAECCRLLQELKIRDCGYLTDRSLEVLREARCSKTLTHLDISKCFKMTEYGLENLFLPFFPRLSTLELEAFRAKKKGNF